MNASYYQPAAAEVLSGDGTAQGKLLSEHSRAVQWWNQFAIYNKNGGAGTTFKSNGVPTMTPTALATAVHCMLGNMVSPMDSSHRSYEGDSATDSADSDNQSSSEEED